MTNSPGGIVREFALRHRQLLQLLGPILLLSGCMEVAEKLSQTGYYASPSDDIGVTPLDATLDDAKNLGDGSEGGDTQSAPGDADTGISGDGAVGSDGSVDSPDTAEPCVFDPSIGDWCDGLDNDCDGQTDEDGGPPTVIEEFKAFHGWTRIDGVGQAQNHLGKPIIFQGVKDAPSLVYLKTTSWKGDIELKFNVLIGTVTEGAELYVGTWSGDDAPSATVTGRVGLSIHHNEEVGKVTVRAHVMDEVLAEVAVKSNEMQSAEIAVLSSEQRLKVRLLRGDGTLAVPEIIVDSVTTIPEYSGLVVAALGAPVIGNIARLSVGPGFECKSNFESDCETSETCPLTENCKLAVCNPFLGCDLVPKYCPNPTACLDASVCVEETGECTSQSPINEGQTCQPQGCIQGATCDADGNCSGGEPVVCPEPGPCQDTAVCNALLDTCIYPSTNEGGVCDDQSLCTENDVCEAGQCVGVSIVECPVAGPCEQPSVCDPSSGECSEILPLDDGTVCDDGDLCTFADVCQDAVCAGQVQECNDDNACTSDLCDAGLCVHTPSAECKAGSVIIPGTISAPAALSSDGNIFVAAKEVHRLALNVADDAAEDTKFLSVAWTTGEDVGEVTSVSPCLSADGTRLYVGDALENKARLVALNTADGTAAWSFEITGVCTGGPGDPCRVRAVPTVASDGTVYAPTDSAGLFALDSEGSQKWHYAELEAAASSVVVGPSGNLYAGQHGLTAGLVSLNSEGTERWKHFTSGTLIQTPIVIEPRIYIATGSAIEALEDGEEQANKVWEYKLEAGTQTQPVMATNEWMVVATGNQVLALNVDTCDGTAEACVAWTYEALPDLGNIGRSLTALNDGRVAFGTQEGFLEFINIVDGLHYMTLDTGSPGTTAPVAHHMDGPGYVFVGAGDGYFNAYHYTSFTGPAESPWPVYNYRQTRNTAISN